MLGSRGQPCAGPHVAGSPIAADLLPLFGCALPSLAVAFALTFGQAVRAGEGPPRKADYTTDFAAPPKRPPPNQLVRVVPEPEALLQAKEAETRLRRELAKADLAALRRVELQKDLVQAVEAAGEDPLAELETLCANVAAVKELGPKVAWEQASEVIGQLYDGRYYEECIRYCRMAIRSPWADRGMRAEAMLRIICCHRQCDRAGAVHPLSERLVREYPETAAARWHTVAAAGWFEAYLRDDEAVALLDRMAEVHKSQADFVRECCREASTICRRTRRWDKLPAYVATLKALAKDLKNTDAKLRERCARDAQMLETVLQRKNQQPAKAVGAPKALK